ncbi:ApeA N-terminal domain 1-containing protein [Nocardia gipuzkoensis]
MSFPKFPSSSSESLGQFGIVDSDENLQGRERTGVVRIDGQRVELEVSPEITPSIDWVEQEDGSWAGTSPSSEPADFVVLGTLAMSPGQTTLWGANTVARRTLGFARPGKDSAGSQRIRASWCLVGECIADPTRLFQELTIEVTNLHEWGGLSGVRHTFPREGGGPRTWQLDMPDSVSAPLQTGDGELSLVPIATMSSPSMSGFSVTANSRVVVKAYSAGWTLRTALSEVVLPLEALMTILSGTRCQVKALTLSDDDVSAEVYGRHIEPSAPKTAGDLLLTRRGAGIELLTRWLELSKKVAPVPEIIAAAYSGEFQTIDTEALSLATAAEALHRLLHPDEMRFEPDEIEAAKAAVSATEMPSHIKGSLISALGTYWAEKSYPQRIKQLAEPVAEAVPECIGKLNKWKSEIVQQRVSLAHGISGDEPRTPDDLLKMYSLTRSLRWMLTLRLLLAAGVGPDQLHAAVQGSERFASDARQWKRDWPTIYPAERASESG